MENKLFQNSLVWSIILGISIIVTGIIFSNAFVKARIGERYVNVKGLAEREVDADLAPRVYRDGERSRCTTKDNRW